MLDVIAFFFAGRFNRMSRTPPDRSVTMSAITAPRSLPHRLLSVTACRSDSACVETLDLARIEPELLENLVGVFADFGSAPGRYFVDAVNLQRAADRELQLPASPLDRNDDVVGMQLRVGDDFERRAHDAERDVALIEHLTPVV